MAARLRCPKDLIWSHDREHILLVSCSSFINTLVLELELELKLKLGKLSSQSTRQVAMGAHVNECSSDILHLRQDGFSDGKNSGYSNH